MTPETIRTLWETTSRDRELMAILREQRAVRVSEVVTFERNDRFVFTMLDGVQFKVATWR